MKRLNFSFLILTIVLSACTSGSKSNNDTTTEETPSETTSGEINVTLEEKWTTDSAILITPESVLFDSENNVLYVSCINGVPPNKQDNDGYISQVDPKNGDILETKWITGLSAPKGMGLYNGKLYVTDIDRIVMIDIASGGIEESIEVEGAVFLNDITVDSEGVVYFSDSNTNTIHALKDGRVSTWKSDTSFGGPNGLLHDGEKLMVASFGTGGLREADYSSQEVVSVVDSIPGGDGVVKVGSDFLVSNWNGEVYYVTSDYRKKKILDTKAIGSNAADIEYIGDSQLLLVPTFFGNSIVAYKVTTD